MVRNGMGRGRRDEDDERPPMNTRGEGATFHSLGETKGLD